MRNRTPITVQKEGIGDRLCQIAARMCKEYCKYQEMLEAEAADCSIRELCQSCPMREL